MPASGHSASGPARRAAAAARGADSSPGATIVFSHGNGFPGETYRQVHAFWRAAGWRVEVVDKFGHDPAYPVTSNWPHLRGQLIDFIERRATVPPILVGHSLGGLLSLMAASRRPDLVRGVVMLDSPVIAGWRAHSVQVAKATGLIRRVSPGRVSATRRHRFPSLAAAREHYAPKHVFARWAPGVLDDYLACGLKPADDGAPGELELAFDRTVETRIYNTLPHNLGPTLRRHPPKCPVALIAGTQSVEIRQGGISMARAVARDRLTWLEGTHLFPMEHPEATAKAVLDAIASFG